MLLINGMCYQSFYSRCFPKMRCLFRGGGFLILKKNKKLNFCKIKKNEINLIPQVYFYKFHIKSYFNFFFNIIIILALFFSIVYYLPMLNYGFFSLFNQSNKEVVVKASREKVVETVIQNSYLPDLDSNLPDGSWIMIPKIGVNSLLQRTQNSTQALDAGVWMDPDFGDVGGRDLPIIIAAHRFGFKWWWKTNYYRLNSFYYLPSLDVGEKIELVKDQRRWIYEIYQKEEGLEISDYSADLILYTCKFLNSPIRYFQYAKLIES